MSRQEKKTFCRVCEPACGLVAEVEDAKLVGLRPDKEHPITKGFACHKGIYCLDIHNDPDRVNTPLRKTPAGTFEEVSWDTALGEIAERLKGILDEHGPSAIAGYTGNPTAFNALFSPAWGGFCAQTGLTKSFTSGTQDCSNKYAGSEAVFGTSTLHPIPDIGDADVVLLFGENPAVSNMSFISIADPMGTLRQAEERGAKIIYVNPRTIESTRFAGEVLHIRPDTDVYLMAALLCEIDQTTGFHEKNAAKFGANVAALRKFVGQYPPERVSAVTGIPTDEIKALAQTFASADRACVHMSTGVNMGRQGTLAYWLMHMLAFVTGNLGRRGGNVFNLSFYSRAPAAGRIKGRGAYFLESPFGTVRAPGGQVPLPGNLMADYLMDATDPVRALFVNAGNPVLSMGGEARMRAALEKMDLVVCVDIYRNATAEYADYILPATDSLEREDATLTGVGLQYQPFVQFTEAVATPQFERREEWWIYARLAQEMGLSSPLDESEAPNIWARLDAMLRSREHNMEELRERGIIQFERSEPETFYTDFLQTDDGRVECFPPVFESAIARMARIFDELSAEPNNQLKLITKRDIHMMNSWYANLPNMKRGDKDRNYLYIHPEDGAQRQLQDGGLVRVTSPFGAIEVALKFSDDLMRGVVAMTHGWGNEKTSGMRVAAQTPGVNCNVLLPSGPDSFEPLSNQAHMTGIPVEVRAAAS